MGFALERSEAFYANLVCLQGQAIENILATDTHRRKGVLFPPTTNVHVLCSKVPSHSSIDYPASISSNATFHQASN